MFKRTPSVLLHPEVRKMAAEDPAFRQSFQLQAALRAPTDLLMVALSIEEDRPQSREAIKDRVMSSVVPEDWDGALALKKACEESSRLAAFVQFDPTGKFLLVAVRFHRQGQKEPTRVVMVTVAKGGSATISNSGL